MLWSIHDLAIGLECIHDCAHRLVTFCYSTDHSLGTVMAGMCRVVNRPRVLSLYRQLSRASG